MPSKTQECLLDAAEALFLEHGFAATSLRSIAEKAEVNLAATNYHFGSKHGLLEAIVHRRVTPINEQRLAELDRLQNRAGTPEVDEILRAFLEPFLLSSDAKHLPEIITRLLSEPPSVIKSLIEREFGEVVSRFSHALSDALPGIPLEQILWRFHFVVGSMLQTIKLPNPVGSLNETHRSVVLDELIAFACAGLQAPLPHNVSANSVSANSLGEES